MSEVNSKMPKYYPDVTHAFDMYRRTRHQGFNVMNVDNPVVRDVVIDFADKQGCFSIKSEFAYNRALIAQRIADANGDKKISQEELEVYNAFNDIYSKPVVGGVEFDSSQLYNIRTVAKNNDGTYTVQYETKAGTATGTYSKQPVDAHVKFSPSLFESNYQNPAYRLAQNS